MVVSNKANSMHDKKISLLKGTIAHRMNNLGLNKDIFLDEEPNNVLGIFPRVFSDYTKDSGDDLRSDTIIPEYRDERFFREIRFWRSEDSTVYGSHWMQDKCTTRSTYFPMFMEEVYDRHDVLTSYFDSHSIPEDSGHPNDRVLGLVTNHDIIFEITGIASIVYTGFGSDNPNKIDAEDFTRHLLSTHPYCNSSTLHELFKILFEWQWAYNELESREPIAKVANDFLVALGLNAKDVDNNPVVKSILSLPDQQLAQYIKTGECHLAEEDPGCPDEFAKWCTEVMTVLNLCIDYKKLLTRRKI